MPYVYMSHDNGELYKASELDDPENPNLNYFTKYEIQESFTLTWEQVCGHYGDVVEILSAANIIK